MAGTTFDKGSWVWLTDGEECYLPAQVKEIFERGGTGRVLLPDGQERALSVEETKSLRHCHEEALDPSIDNLIRLNDLTEATLLHNLRERFRTDAIYTHVSSILISVNPFKLLPLYTPSVLEAYIGPASHDRPRPPHIFSTAANAYDSLLSTRANQSVIISGESGAGKSEATKLILQYLAEASSRASSASTSAVQGGVIPESDADASTSLEQQILQSNPLMEAFGNAKTVRNNNSSRFGKLITVNFDQMGAMAGGSIVSYLLEKTRVVHQMAQERNYHIFYQLLSSAHKYPDLRLDSPSTFTYTNQSGVDRIEGVNDEHAFEEVVGAMRTLGLTGSEEGSVLRTVAAVLHFGNVVFEAEARHMQEDGAKVTDTEHLAFACSLIGVDVELMTRVLTFRNFGNKSMTLVPYTPAGAGQARDAMARTLYAALFDWLMKKINHTLGRGSTMGGTSVNVLDVFGFELFETNSFEQLCINFCNEKLQHHFNEHIFRLEEQEYASEGVTVPSTEFKDNKPTLMLLEDKTQGIFSMIDDEMSVPRGTDDTYLSKVKTKFAKHESFVLPKPSQKIKDSTKVFGVRHYAGEVFYNVAGFLEKNRDILHGDITAALQSSSSPFVQELFPRPKAEAVPTHGKARVGTMKTKASVAAQFKSQLGTLMETLNSTCPHFVRCLKPNSLKRASVFESPMMLAQLRYAGLLEACRIRKLGYPIRHDHHTFYRRYKCVSPGVDNLDGLLRSLTNAHKLHEGLWAKGHTRVFLKPGQEQELEMQRDNALVAFAVKIKAHMRAWLARKRYRLWRRVLEDLRAAMRDRVLTTLDNCIDMTTELPHNGDHLSDVKAAKALRHRLIEEERVIRLVDAAISVKDLSTLRAAVNAARGMSPPLVHASVDRAQAILQRLEEEVEVRAQLQAAISTRDASKLTEGLRRAQAMSLDAEEVSQVKHILARMQVETQLVADLRQAISVRDVDMLSTLLSKAAEIGFDAPEVVQAGAMQKQVQREAAARQALVAAVRSREMKAVSSAVEAAVLIGLWDTTAELVDARRVLSVLQEEQRCMKGLKEATESRDFARLNAALDAADKLRLTALPEFAFASSVRDQLACEQSCRDTLRSAVESSNTELLSKALTEAAKLHLSGPEVDAALAMNQKQSAHSTVLMRLRVALSSQDVAEMDGVLSEAEGMDLGSTHEVVALRQRKLKLEVEAKIIRGIRAALSARDADDLSRLVAEAAKTGMPASQPEVSQAREMSIRLTEGDKIEKDLMLAINDRSADALRTLLDRARAHGVVGSTVAEAEKVLSELENEDSLVTELSEAIQCKDYAHAQTLLEEARAKNVAESKLHAFALIINRSVKSQRIRERLTHATTQRSHRALQQSISVAMNDLGLDDPALRRAMDVRDELARVERLRADMAAATKTLKMKAESEWGIDATDLEPLKEAIDQATEAGGLFMNDEEIISAQHLLAKLTSQLETQALLRTALKSRQEEALRTAVYRAEVQGLSLGDVKQAKAVLKRLDSLAARAAQEEEQRKVEEAAAPPPKTREEIKQEKHQRRQRCRNPLYDVSYYCNLRSPDEYAKGVMLNKKRVKDGMLTWQNSIILKSLLELDTVKSKLAVQLHKNILGYMGDKAMSFPATLAQEILEKGYGDRELRDEIYIQVMKQLTGNKKEESECKGWQLLCMCASTFPPSAALQDHVIHFLLTHEADATIREHYARFCLVTLEPMLNTSGGFVPSIDEILAYKERPPMLATIQLVDGTLIGDEDEPLPVMPDMDVGKVLEWCVRAVGMIDSRSSTFGIFVRDVMDGAVEQGGGAAAQQQQSYIDLPRAPRGLRNDEYLGTVLYEKMKEGQAFTLVYKRKIFMPGTNGPSPDPVYRRLMYLQLCDETLVAGNLRIDREEQAVLLAVIAMRVKCGDAYQSAEPLAFLPPAWRNKPRTDVCEKVMKMCRKSNLEQDEEELQQMFVDIVTKHPLFGSHFFHVLKQGGSSVDQVVGLPKELILGVNHSGVHVFDGQTWELLQKYGYAEVQKWGGSSTQFSLVLCDKDQPCLFTLSLVTAQATAIAATILDHIHAIMARSSTR